MTKQFRLNQQIKAREVRLIDDEEKLNTVSLEEALRLANEKGLDLVEVAPNDQPPVCKIMDYGKYLYRQKKIEQKHKKSQKQKEMKGLRLSFRTDKHDLETKVKQATEFLKKGNSVKISLIFKGREIAYKHLAREKMDFIKDSLKEVAKIEENPKIQGMTMMMVLTPAYHKEPAKTETLATPVQPQVTPPINNL